MNYFWAGPDLVRWTVEVADSIRTHHVRLVMVHGGGSIVEYFSSTETALGRQLELEELLMAARGFENPIS